MSDKEDIGSIAEFKLRYGSLLNQQAQELGVDPNVLGGVIWVASSGTGFVNGNLIIRFENGWFNDFTQNQYAGSNGLFMRSDGVEYYRTSTDQEWQLVHKNQESEYAAFELAKSINSDAAYNSISMERRRRSDGTIR
jgi:hypothetical protein